ncbi:hypothetical protein [Streptococcus infantarius]|uniref:hypothetical protein n=1 Tax=Streptococcus infantarius TaxID=102684 RepID=UPI0022E6F647|nr:hypothetical protein [Streptococcus infantarius]MDV2595182.1 hypothetical protein [Streptococcus infantarius]
MKIKLFKRELVADGYYSNGITRTRQENNKELENRINEFMADKKVSSVQAYGDNIIVMYEEVK